MAAFVPSYTCCTIVEERTSVLSLFKSEELFSRSRKTGFSSISLAKSVTHVGGLSTANSFQMYKKMSLGRRQGFPMCKKLKVAAMSDRLSCSFKTLRCPPLSPEHYASQKCLLSTACKAFLIPPALPLDLPCSIFSHQPVP